MKKFLLLLVLGLVLVLGTASMVSANAGPHGGYTATTDACAGCHRAHTATGPQLLVESSTYALCMSCHGTAGTGADTNVEDGFFLSSRSPSTDGTANTTDNAPLLGGGFTNYGGFATTSNHDVSGTITDAWGNGGTRGVATALAASETLDCASCHDPHGSNNYRIIKETINGNPVAGAQVDEGAAKDYDDEDCPATMSNVCAACHTAYHVTTAGSGSDGAMVATGGYTHRVDMPYTYGSNVNPETPGWGGYTLPLADSGTGDLVACSTCHLSHGSSAAQGTNSEGATGPDVPGGTGDSSALLRLDNRGVCEVCHQK